MTTLQEAIYNAILDLGNAAFTRAIWTITEVRLGGKISIGEIFNQLDIMEEAGWIAYSVEPGSPERGNRPKRFYWIREEATV